MERSTDRALTTHADSVSCRDDLAGLLVGRPEGEPVDEAMIEERVREAVREIVVRVHPQVARLKLRALAEGATIAAQEQGTAAVAR